jgi:hypothetical protein
MKTTTRFATVAVAALFSSPLYGQGTFQNLDFESANLPVIPAGQYGSFVPVADALPFWNAYLGASQITQVQHNNAYLGTANISIFGPEWSFPPRIEGTYTVLLQPGSTGQGVVDASIGQTGLIPAGTESMRFKSDPFSSDFAVSIGGVPVPALQLGAYPNYSLFGTDVSAFAGLTEELRITALFRVGGSRFAYLDSIEFSNLPIPEPSVLGLFAIGALFLGLPLRWMRKA